MLNTLKLIFLAVLIALGFGVYYYHEQSEHYCELYKNASANTKFLIKETEKNIARTLEISKRNEQLEKLVKFSQESCWTRNIPNNDPILIRVRSD